MDDPEDDEALDEAMALGLSVLTQIVENTPDGAWLGDDRRRIVYANRAASRLLGKPIEDLVGRDYVDCVQPQHRRATRRYHGSLLRTGSTEMLTRMLVGADGQEREGLFAPLTLDLDGRRHGAAFFHDVTEIRAAARTAGALAQSVADLVATESINDVFAGIARHAVEGTRARWAGVAVVGEDGGFDIAGAYGPDGPDFGEKSIASKNIRSAPAREYLAAMTRGAIQVGQAPGRAATLARTEWEQDPILSTYGRHVLDVDWQTAVTVPLVHGDEVVGALAVALPPEVSAASDVEVSFCGALADHAAAAVANDRMAREAARGATSRERARLARDLHDSVSQTLFAITMHIRAAELGLAADGRDRETPAARSIGQLSRLAQGALADTRSLIVERRPDALLDDDLVEALGARAAAISAREHVDVTVDAPHERLSLASDVETHLYRIVCEALHNVVKHAEANHAVVAVETVGPELRVTVIDDGTGFVPAATQPGRLGLSTMMQRAEEIGARLTVQSFLGRGTSVTVSLTSDGGTPASGARP